MRNARLAAVAVAGALAVPSTAVAAYEPPPIVKQIVNGCYGVGIVVCDVNVTSLPVELDSRTVPVCAITCQDVTVPVPTSSREDLCVGWTDDNGTPSEVCVP